MDTRKVIIYGFVGVMMLSCGQKDTSSMDIEELRRECEELREDRAKSLENNVEAQELIDNIFASLNTISGRTASLERAVENGAGMDNRSKAEEIAQDIKLIKEKLEDAEKTDQFDKSTQMVISKLKSAIEQKQSEIDDLKAVIAQKDEEISRLGEQVTSLDTELGETSEKLSESNVMLQEAEIKLKYNEINSWIQMGDELMYTADMLPKVKGHGNMKPVKQAKLKILLRAKECFMQAQNLGSTMAPAKIAEAERRYYDAN